MKTVLVTGVNGLVGSNLARLLLRHGCHVRGLVRERSDRRSIDGLDLELIEGDVRDPSSVLRGMKGADTVFHTAAVISHWKKERQTMMDVNIGGTKNVLAACVTLGVRRLVHTSSIAAIGIPPDGGTIDERTPDDGHPRDVGYRKAKHGSERLVDAAVRDGLDAVIVNPSVIMGPGDYRFHGGRMIRDVYRRRIFYAPPGGTNVVAVSDVAAGHLAAALQGRTGERYILAGEDHTFAELFTITAEVVGGITPKFTVPVPAVQAVAWISEGFSSLTGLAPWVSRELVSGIRTEKRYSSAKAQRELGYTYRSFRETVRETFAWYRLHGLL